MKDPDELGHGSRGTATLTRIEECDFCLRPGTNHHHESESVGQAGGLHRHCGAGSRTPATTSSDTLPGGPAAARLSPPSRRRAPASRAAPTRCWCSSTSTPKWPTTGRWHDGHIRSPLRDPAYFRQAPALRREYTRPPARWNRGQSGPIAPAGRCQLLYGELLWCEHLRGEREDVPVVSEEQNLARCSEHSEAAKRGASAVVVEIDKDVIEDDRHRTVCGSDRSDGRPRGEPHRAPGAQPSNPPPRTGAGAAARSRGPGPEAPSGLSRDGPTGPRPVL